MANKNITMKQKVSGGYDTLYPKTIIAQVESLQTALDAKLAKAFNTLTQKQSIADNDLIAINDSANSNAPAYIAASVLKNYVQDPHNKGYFENPTALSTAYPTAAAGDFAVVGSTDTIWVWDTGTSAWVNADTSGAVTSVNGQTGAVTVSTPGNLTIGSNQPVSMSTNITLAAVAGSGSYNDLTNKPTIQKIVVSAQDPTTSISEGDFWYEVTA